MSEEELIRQLGEVKQKGFDESFASFCAKTYSSRRYTPGNLAAAKMHAFYLRLALEMLTDAEGREELFRAAAEGGRMEEAFREVTRESYRAALESARPFCEVFVEKWCERVAKA